MFLKDFVYVYILENPSYKRKSDGYNQLWRGVKNLCPISLDFIILSCITCLSVRTIVSE